MQITLLTTKTNIQISSLTQLLEKSEKEKEKLQETIKELASQSIAKPTTTNTLNLTQNYIKNMKPLDLSEDHIKSIFSRLSTQDITEYADGIAKFLRNNLFTDENKLLKYACTDASRKSFKYKDTNNILQSDNKCTTLFEHMYDILQKNIQRVILDANGSDEYKIRVLFGYYEEFSNHKVFKPSLISAIANHTTPKRITTLKKIQNDSISE